MKKINLQNIKDSLTKNELSKIMAGSGNDVNNNNSVAQCYCTFNNNSVSIIIILLSLVAVLVNDKIHLSKVSSTIYENHQSVIFDA